MKGELHADPSMGHAQKGSAELKQDKGRAAVEQAMARRK